MRQVVMHGPGDVRVEDREDPKIIEPTDAIIRLTATCICGSDLWPYRGAEPVKDQVMGHEYVGVVEEVGSAVRTIKVGDFVVGSFWASDNSCEICQAGYQAYCVHRVLMGTIGTQSELARVPLADGTLVATPGMPEPDLIPSLMAASDVLGTGWFAAEAAEAGPGKTVGVVGDGAVGLLGILAAKQLGAERVIAFSRHADRQALAREFGATDIVEERGDDGVARVKELTGGLGAHSVIEAVGTQEAMMQAIHSTRPGGHVGFVGVSHDVAIPGDELFMAGVHRVTITIGEQRLHATLSDSAAARALLAQLPVTVDMTDHAGSSRPEPSLDGLPDGADPDVGDLGYYPPATTSSTASSART